MTEAQSDRYSAFTGGQLVAQGALAQVARAIHGDQARAVLVLDDATGRPVDLDLRGSVAEAVARLAAAEPETKPRGRPRLGVIAREVTLLPRHWDWLASQRGGASAALRRLVETARRDSSPSDVARQASDAAYHAMTVLAGDLHGYEEASRAFFAQDHGKLDQLMGAWPVDVRDYLRRLMARIGASPA